MFPEPRMLKDVFHERLKNEFDHRHGKNIFLYVHVNLEPVRIFYPLNIEIGFHLGHFVLQQRQHLALIQRQPVKPGQPLHHVGHFPGLAQIGQAADRRQRIV
ncbi:hypothetical protein D1872_263600 [compost metagenome]